MYVVYDMFIVYINFLENLMVNSYLTIYLKMVLMYINVLIVIANIYLHLDVNNQQNVHVLAILNLYIKYLDFELILKIYFDLYLDYLQVNLI